MLVPFENLDGATCADVVLETSIDCPRRQFAEALCCPSAASTCSICKGTKLLADVEVTDYLGVTWSCREIAYYAANFEATSQNCTNTRNDFEKYCCPDAPCKVCDGDFRQDMLVPFENVDGATCADAVLGSSLYCSSRQFAEALCCPSAASTCSICKGTKLLADVEVTDYLTGVTWSCRDIAYYAAQKKPSTSDCRVYLSWEAYCCPDVFSSWENRDSSILINNSMLLSLLPPPIYSASNSR